MSPCFGDGYVKHIVKMFGNEEVREKCLCSKWLSVNEDVAYMKIINCRPTNVIHLKKNRKYMYKIRCRWDSSISKM
jgi:hypothetical protein